MYIPDISLVQQIRQEQRNGGYVGNQNQRDDVHEKEPADARKHVHHVALCDRTHNKDIHAQRRRKHTYSKVGYHDNAKVDRGNAGRPYNGENQRCHNDNGCDTLHKLFP